MLYTALSLNIVISLSYSLSFAAPRGNAHIYSPLALDPLTNTLPSALAVSQNTKEFQPAISALFNSIATRKHNAVAQFPLLLLPTIA